MTTTPMLSRTVPALVTGAATAMYYATPDFIASRRARGWTKAGLTVVILTTSVPEFRAARAAERRQHEHGGEPVPSEVFTSLPSKGKVAVLGTAAAVLAGAVGSGAVVERWIFRRGQARATAGERLPHTRAALLYGALAAGLCLLPTPPAPGDVEAQA